MSSYLFPKTELIRPHVDEEGAWHFFGGDLRIFPGTNGGGVFTSRQIFKQGSPHAGSGRASTATPPLHWHIYQTESFDVQKGVMCYELGGNPGKVLAGGKVTIPPGHFHTFWSDPESPDVLDVLVSVSGGPNPGFDETFVHNFYGYLSSVVAKGTTPNLFQMLAFLDSADIVIADFPLGLGRIANIVLGRWIGKYLGGYETDYKVFSAKFDE